MSTRRRSRRALAMAFALSAIVVGPLAGSPGQHLVRAATPFSMLYLSQDSAPYVGKVRSIVVPAEGTMNANGSSFGDPAGSDASFGVTPTDADEDGSQYQFEFLAPAGQLLVPGTYTATGERYDRAAGVAYFSMVGGGCFGGETSFTIAESAFDGDGKPTAFAASWATTCPTYTEAGEVRWNSTVGVKAVDIGPMDITYPLTDQGSTSATKDVTVTNTGTLAVTMQPALADAQMTIVSQCPTTLAVGASCTIGAATQPTLPDAHGSYIHVRTNTIASSTAVHTVVYGRVDTTTTLTSSKDPDIYPDAPTILTATITPTPPNGSHVQFYVDGNPYGSPDSITQGNGVAAFAGRTGSHTITAAFTGATYFKPSTSNSVSQNSMERPTLNLYVSPVQGPPEQPVLIVSSIARASGSTLAKGGTVTLTDELTGETLATFGMADATPKKAICPNRLTVGTHRIRASYSGFGDIVATTKFVDVVVAAGASVTAGTIDPAGSGVIRCATFRTLDEAYQAPPGSLTTVNVSTITTILGGVATRPISNVRISDSGELTPNGVLKYGDVLPYGAAFEWSLEDPALGGVDGDGQRTIWWQLQTDDGIWYAPFSVTLVLDRAAPAGDVTVAGGATYAVHTTVTLDVPGSDEGTGLSSVALSNDGSTWTTRAYAPSQSWTLPSSNGTKTVYAKWKDAAGNWSPVKTDSIVLDTVAPTVTAPGKAFVSGATLSSTSTPTRFTWTGADATAGVARYEAAQSTDGAAYSTITTTLTSPGLTRNLAAGHTYRLRVRAVDRAGNAGAWVAGATFTVGAYQETSSRITYSGTWTHPSGSGYWGGYEKSTTAAGAKATFTFTGRAFAWIGCVGPTRGSAKIYVNGVLTKTVNLNASATACKRVVASLSWSSSASRQIRVVVSGTAGHPRVGIDALVIAT